jgi:hypothetical protein
VGGHLTAIAVKKSVELGYDGCVWFVAKTRLKEHYAKTLKAIILPNNRMLIDEVASKYILDKYTLTEMEE